MGNGDERVIEILANTQEQLVDVSRDGHQATQAAIRELGDRLETQLSRSGKIIILLVVVLAGLSGLRLVLPDGTSIAPASASEGPSLVALDAPE